jgi:exodeoxyribonuclease VII large subunit
VRRYTVVQITAELGQLIGDRYPQIEVEGEISALSVPASGHAYITLAEGDSILAAVAWRSTWQALPRPPKRGDRVVCRGKLGVYPGKGSYQMYVHAISASGEGALAAEIAKRRARLEAEGLLDPRRKRPLPKMPRCVGVATSLTGAALQDLLKVSRERFPAARILVSHCLVQGASAPGSVTAAIELLLEDGRAEVIVVTRGGGSKEDLLAFQDEGLARFLAHCPVPVVSAVGHQVDTTLADLVADAVAPTPTGAAAVVLPDAAALAQRVDELAAALARVMQHGVHVRRARVGALQGRLRHPGERLALVRRRATELEARLRRLLPGRLAAGRARVTALEDRLRRAVPGRIVGGRARAEALRERLLSALRLRLPRQRDRLAVLEQRLRVAMQRRLERLRDRVERLEGRARALSPEAVLERGFALVTGPGGVITDAAQVAPGDRVEVRVRRGRFGAAVE